MQIRTIQPEDRAAWLRMRDALWPGSFPDHVREIDTFFTEVRDDLAIFVLVRPDGTLGGFLEVALRGYAEGCATTPVGYLEGLYLDPELRGRGLSGQLVAAAEAWAQEQGCQEMASDCLLDNTHSLAVHLALGYSEVERIICFRKPLNGNV